MASSTHHLFRLTCMRYNYEGVESQLPSAAPVCVMHVETCTCMWLVPYRQCNLVSELLKKIRPKEPLYRVVSCILPPLSMVILINILLWIMTNCRCQKGSGAAYGWRETDWQSGSLEEFHLTVFNSGLQVVPSPWTSCDDSYHFFCETLPRHGYKNNIS